MKTQLVRDDPHNSYGVDLSCLNPRCSERTKARARMLKEQLRRAEQFVWDIYCASVSSVLTISPAIVYKEESKMKGDGSAVPGGVISTSFWMVSALACSRARGVTWSQYGNECKINVKLGVASNKHGVPRNYGQASDHLSRIHTTSCHIVGKRASTWKRCSVSLPQQQSPNVDRQQLV